MPRHPFCTQQCGREGTLEGEVNSVGHNDRDTDYGQPSRTANYGENTICSVEGSLGLRSSFTGIPCPSPDPALLLLGWDVLSDDFHVQGIAPQNQPLDHPNPKSKITLYKTRLSCYLFLQVIFLTSTCRPENLV